MPNQPLTPTIDAEIVQETDKLVKYASQTGLETSTTDTLVQAFWPVFDKSKKALAECKGVAESVKDATCVTEIRKARACRLALRTIRIEAEGIHKKQKENALRFGRAVDGFRNILLADIEPVEQALQEAEDTAERMEAARKASLKASREAELKPYLDGPTLVDLAEISEDDYFKVLSDAKLLKQAKIDAALKAEKERREKEEAEQKERARIAAENEKLRAEVAAKEAAAKAEREAAEKKLADERAAAQKVAKEIEEKARKEAEKAAAENRKLQVALEAKAKAEREAKAKSDADAKAQALAAKKAAAAPDKAKLEAFAGLLENITVPRTNDPEIETQLKDRMNAFIKWCFDTASGL